MTCLQKTKLSTFYLKGTEQEDMSRKMPGVSFMKTLYINSHQIIFEFIIKFRKENDTLAGIPFS